MPGSESGATTPPAEAVPDASANSNIVNFDRTFIWPLRGWRQRAAHAVPNPSFPAIADRGCDERHRADREQFEDASPSLLPAISDRNHDAYYAANGEQSKHARLRQLASGGARRSRKRNQR